jgi:hypothetical protein
MTSLTTSRHDGGALTSWATRQRKVHPHRFMKNTHRHLVGATQFSDLSTQPADLFGLGGGRPVEPLTMIGFVLAEPVAQRFGMHTELLGQPADHRLRVGLPVELDRPTA